MKLKIEEVQKPEPSDIAKKHIKSILKLKKLDNNISKKECRQVDSVIVDDDDFVNEGILKFSSSRLNKKYDFYRSPEEFARHIDLYSLEIPLYIDSRLGNRVKGEIVSRVFYEYGFREIYLYTNTEEDELNFSLEKLYWLKGIVKKDQIWRRQ